MDADGIVKTRYIRLLLLLFLPSIFFSFWVICLISNFSAEPIQLRQCWSIFCCCFLLDWWVVYFSSPFSKVWTLRLFLINKSKFRRKTTNKSKAQLKKAIGDGNDPEKIFTKVGFTMGSQSIFLAVIALFLALAVEIEVTNYYQRVLHIGVLVLALLATILMVLAVDILDTISNNFVGGEDAAKNYRDWLYRRVGPFFPRGGVSYAYLGYACFSVFLIFSIALFHPCLASVGVGIYFYLGFPFLFGYAVVVNKKRTRS